jgi:triosephosphate isomerase
MTGAEYPFCQTDGIVLKTIIRSNPGLVLLKNGIIIRKWSHNELPVIAENRSSLPLEQFEEGHMPKDSVPRKIADLLMWFVLPLALLSLADRTWMWTKWLRHRHP